VIEEILELIKRVENNKRNDNNEVSREKKISDMNYNQKNVCMSAKEQSSTQRIVAGSMEVLNLIFGGRTSSGDAECR
jgi:hypothetical protein